MANEGFKHLPSVNYYLVIATNPKYNEYQRGFASIIFEQFDEKSSTIHKGTRINSNAFLDNQCPSDLARLVKVSDRTCQLADKLHKTFI